MSDEELKQSSEEPNVEREEEPKEEKIEEIREAELPPTPQDIDMPPVKSPKEESGE